MSWLEWIATALGVANVWLIVRRSIWNYPFGILMVALYAFVFWNAKLYSDAGLQIFFLVVQAYGWWAWSGDCEREGDIRVRRLGPRPGAVWLGGVVVATVGWGRVMSFTDASFPYWDAAVAMLSVAAQILMTRRYLENWMGWIVVDVLAVGLYAAKALYLTAGLYLVFLVMAVWGLTEWRAALRRQWTVA